MDGSALELLAREIAIIERLILRAPEMTSVSHQSQVLVNTTRTWINVINLTEILECPVV